MTTKISLKQQPPAQSPPPKTQPPAQQSKPAATTQQPQAKKGEKESPAIPNKQSQTSQKKEDQKQVPPKNEAPPPKPKEPEKQKKAAEIQSPQKINNTSADQNQADKLQALKEKQDQYLKGLLKEVGNQEYCEESHETVNESSRNIFNKIVDGKIQIHSSPQRKADVAEESIIDKQMQDAKKLKESLKAQLDSVQVKIGNLSSQRIPKSLYSHPVLKQYLFGDSENKRKQALRFVKKMQRQKILFEEKLKARIQESINKKKEEELQTLLEKKIEKETKIKDREEELKQSIEDIRSRQENRLRQLQEFQETYIKKIKKEYQKPLFLRQRKKYSLDEEMFRQEKLKEFKEQKQMLNAISIDEMKSHEKKYFDNLQKMQDEKKQQREKEISELREKHPMPKLIYDSANLYKNTADNLISGAEADIIAKQNAKKNVEARSKFSMGLKQHQQLPESKEKRLEMEILIDKQVNPQKYIVVIKKRTDEERYQQLAQRGKSLRKISVDKPLSKSVSEVYKKRNFQSQNKVKEEDELIFKEKAKIGFKRLEPGMEKEIGNMYLRKIKDSVKQYREMTKRMHSEGYSSRLSNEGNQESNKTEPRNQSKQGQKEQLPKQRSSKSSLSDIPFLPSIQKDSQNGHFNRKRSSNIDYQNSSQSDRKDLNKLGLKNILNSPHQIKSEESKDFENSKLNAQSDSQSSLYHTSKKKDYMAEVRKRLNLDQRKEKWERISESNEKAKFHLPPIKQQMILQEASNKYDEVIKRKEQLMRMNKSSELTLKDVENREELDQAYYKSIKTKIAMMKLSADAEGEIDESYQLSKQKQE